MIRNSERPRPEPRITPRVICHAVAPNAYERVPDPKFAACSSEITYRPRSDLPRRRAKRVLDPKLETPSSGTTRHPRSDLPCRRAKRVPDAPTVSPMPSPLAYGNYRRRAYVQRRGLCLTLLTQVLGFVSLDACASYLAGLIIGDVTRISAS